ncbi:hypothetical protein [Streptomyces sp. UNOC14_S4]|uniref:hypothetical protein n=1 Tax=Streptomyces sp. UNOC14_S4 TaxID=2872340 RepID=UPI001E50995C|nr:hypothetical protein [Streptomyces sp. UNOC14_S4]MCC3768233.1 hypothetical protein [Streptomyces sp. UNOC14_S4]
MAPKRNEGQPEAAHALAQHLELPRSTSDIGQITGATFEILSRLDLVPDPNQRLQHRPVPSI